MRGLARGAPVSPSSPNRTPRRRHKGWEEDGRPDAHQQLRLLLGGEDGEVDHGAQHDQGDREDKDHHLLAILLQDSSADVIDAEHCQRGKAWLSVAS